jgi:hypothetical protein
MRPTDEQLTDLVDALVDVEVDAVGLDADAKVGKITDLCRSFFTAASPSPRLFAFFAGECSELPCSRTLRHSTHPCPPSHTHVLLFHLIVCRRWVERRFFQ